MRRLRRSLEVLHDGGDQMSLRIWLPLNGDLKNLGTDQSIVPSIMGTGITYSSGKIGQAATFPNNSNSCIHMPGLKLQIFSWTAWFKVSGEGSSSSQRFMSEGRDCGSVGTNLWVSKAGTTLSWSTHMKSGSTSILLNTWYHVGLIADGSNIKLYLNGELKSTTAYTENSDYAQSNDKLVLGKMAYYYMNVGSYFPFNGQLNDVRVYGHALSEKEIKKISQGLILHYALNRSGFGQENLLSGNNAKILTWTNYMPNSVTLSGDGYDNKYTLIKGIGGWEKIFTEPITVTSGDTYTLSFIYSVEQDYVGYSGQFGLSVCSTSQNKYGNDTDVITKFNFGLTKKDKTKASITFTPNSDTIYLVANGGCINDGQENISFYISYLKLEKGEKATPWCPNFTSAEYNILNLNNNIEYDMSGYNHNGTYIGNIAFESDSPKYNASVHLLSTDLRSYTSDNACYLISSNTLNIDKNAMTIAFWGKLQLGYGGGWQGVFCTSLYEGNDYTTSALNHYDTGVRVNASDGSYLRPIPPFVANEWHHYVFVYDGINFIIYKDGAVSSTSSFSSKKTLGDFNKIIIGLSVAGGAWRKNNCNFSDFRIYATALSQADIAELYSIHRS